MFGCRYVNQPLDYSGQYGMGYLKRMSRCPNCREDEASVLAQWASSFLRLEDCSQERACRRIVAAVTAQKEEPSAVGWTEELREQGRAVGVAPLQVIDRQDQRTPIAQAGQELTQARRRGAAAPAGRGQGASRGAVATASASPSVGKTRTRDRMSRGKSACASQSGRRCRYRLRASTTLSSAL